MSETSVYPINKGVNESIEFLGLRAQYIWYMGGTILGLLFLFGIIYGIGLPTFICIIIVFGLGAFAFFFIYKLNDKYGEHGLMKKAAQRRMPDAVNCSSRSLFINLNNTDNE
ncbi:hypothetical protein AAKU52_002629 [Pedobacter sp. CG_S7]|uniref:DUF4133 domain-containing protein n=1 Tax=Pedobacter sp. CG_S7 TaxID=3143930 RepID=UPI0033971F14